MKKFITTISLQFKDLDPMVYTAVDNKDLQYEEPIAFPILSAIHASVQKDEHIIVYPILLMDSSSEGVSNHNFELFEKELQALSVQNGFTFEIQKIEHSASDDIDSLLSLFSKMLDIPKDDDMLSACITYGTKPISIVTMMALHYSYKVKTNLDIKHIVYGKRIWGGEAKGEIYDVTPLFYVNSAVEHLAKLQIQSPENALRAMLDLGE